MRRPCAAVCCCAPYPAQPAAQPAPITVSLALPAAAAAAGASPKRQHGRGSRGRRGGLRRQPAAGGGGHRRDGTVAAHVRGAQRVGLLMGGVGAILLIIGQEAPELLGCAPLAQLLGTTGRASLLPCPHPSMQQAGPGTAAAQLARSLQGCNQPSWCGWAQWGCSAPGWRKWLPEGALQPQRCLPCPAVHVHSCPSALDRGLPLIESDPSPSLPCSAILRQSAPPPSKKQPTRPSCWSLTCEPTSSSGGGTLLAWRPASG